MDATGLLTLVGGVSGLLMILYMGAMLWYKQREDKRFDSLQQDIAFVKGFLLGKGGKR